MSESRKQLLKKKIKYRKEMISDIESGYMQKDNVWSDYKAQKLQLYQEELIALEAELKCLSSKSARVR